MSTIQPPPPSPPNTIIRAAANPPVLSVIKPTPELLATLRTSQFPATVLHPPADGRSAIETPLGRFTIETTIALKQGQALLLQPSPLNTAGKDNFMLQILEIAGKPTVPSAKSPLTPSPAATSLAQGSSKGFPAASPLTANASLTPGTMPLATTSPAQGSSAGLPASSLNTNSAPTPSTLSLIAGSTTTATLLSTSPVFTRTANGAFTVTQNMTQNSPASATSPAVGTTLTSPTPSLSTAPSPNISATLASPVLPVSTAPSPNAGTALASPTPSALTTPSPTIGTVLTIPTPSVSTTPSPAVGTALTSPTSPVSTAPLHAAGKPSATNPASQGTGAIQTGSTAFQHASGSQFNLTIQSVTPAGTGTAWSSTTPVLPFLPGQVINGTATGQFALGHTVVQTPTATINIPTATPLPAGTEISFKVETQPQLSDSGHISIPSLHRESLLFSRSWPSLAESVHLLEQTNPAVARQLGEHVLPKLNVKFTATALFFLSALRGGDVRAWIGGTASKILEQTKPDLLKKLGDDFRALGSVDDSGNTPVRAMDWRGTLLPIQTQDGIEQIRLYFRHFQEDENEENAQPRRTGNRFVIDVTLSNIGRLQLDGMVEKHDKRLDLIIRTSSPLPQIVRQEMANLFTAANDIVGMRGAMSFQASPDGFIDPLALADASAAGPGIVV